VPRGGVIAVDLSGEGDAMTMHIEAKGPNARLSHSAAEFLSNAPPKDAIDGHSIQLYFTTLLAYECHATVSVSTGPECVTLAAVPTPPPAELQAPAHSLDSSSAA
jgi:histidine phosphotransferase ChpT